MLMLDIKSIQVARLLSSKCCRPSTIIVKNWSSAPIIRYDLRREPKMGILSEIRP